MKAALLAVVFVSSGCSWTFSRPPPPPSPTRPPCSPGYLAPVLDTYQAVSGGAVTLAMLSLADGGDFDTIGVLVLITGGLTALHAASASYGFKQARRCREMRQQIAETPVIDGRVGRGS